MLEPDLPSFEREDIFNKLHAERPAHWQPDLLDFSRTSLKHRHLVGRDPPG